MKIEIETSGYNARRYGRPWIARVDFAENPKGDFSFGAWVGEDGYEGMLLVDANAGDIVARGQKDSRNLAKSAPYFYLVKDGGELEALGTKGNAYKYWRSKQAVGICVKELMQEKDRLLARLKEIDDLLAKEAVK